MRFQRTFGLFALLATASASLLLHGASAAPPPLTAAEDHQRLLDLLGIDHLRRGADGDPASPHAANYDEDRANAHLPGLPDSLRLDDGRPVRTADQWWSLRRPELVEHFDREIYGRVPDDLPPVNWLVREKTAQDLAGKAIETYSVTGVVDAPAHPGLRVEMLLSLTVPAAAEKPVPVILQLVFDDATMKRIRTMFSDEQWAALRGSGPGWQEQVIGRGWGYAELVATSVQADSGDGLQRGIIGLGNAGAPRDPDDWGALRAWAWGASRALDFLQEHARTDASRVGIMGHSRYGKAALVAMAYDSRFAAAFVSSSGEGGAKLWRRHFGEQIGNIAGSGEYHWVAGNFLRYAGPLTVDDLPVDAHQLIALCAPRAVFVSSGDDGDQWTDPRGMFLAARAASPVFELLGAGGLGADEYPSVGTALTDGAIAWRQHSGGHTPGPNWPYFLDFAARAFASHAAAPQKP